jgi:defect-in-organelle-trafficking protein DotC
MALDALQNVEKQNKVIDEGSGLPFDIRKEAIREAAISFGARGGLAWRTYEINRELGKRARYMDKVFDGADSAPRSGTPWPPVR